MSGEIIISIEKMKEALQLNIFIPDAAGKASKLFIQNSDGSLLKQFLLTQGSNQIDISELEQPSFLIKVETANETILKKIDIL